MRRYRKWVLTLGMMAATPGVSMAGPLPQLQAEGEQTQSATSTAQATKQHNQQIAEAIAAALRAERLSGFDIEIGFKGGTATLRGKIANAEQKARAEQAIKAINGVAIVKNQLETIDGSTTAEPKQLPASNIEQTNHQGTALPAVPPAIPDEIVPVSQAAGAGNQEIANQIAGALGQADLKGYDIEIRFQNNTALLSGSVATPQQQQLATQVASEVAGVMMVDNRLTVIGDPSAPSLGKTPTPQAGSPYAGQPDPRLMGINPVAYQAAAGQPAAMGAPAPYGVPAAQASHAAYDMPHMPNHAWPSYAAYPNYAQVAYPQDYSASAWPYIGPFYPYPQVPLGWREAQLEWDDGHWNLNFNARTGKWWWFLKPENW